MDQIEGKDGLYGKRISKIREHRGMSQADLAAAIGVSRSVISNAESGRTRISVGRIERIAAALHCELDDLRAPLEAPLPRVRFRGGKQFGAGNADGIRMGGGGGEGPQKTYSGIRLEDGTACVRVSVKDQSRELPLRLDLANHSPTGFEWGYAGSGPAQLALAILADALGDDASALRLHQKFKFAFIAPLPRAESWTMTESQVRRFRRGRKFGAAR